MTSPSRSRSPGDRNEAQLLQITIPHEDSAVLDEVNELGGFPGIDITDKFEVQSTFDDLDAEPCDKPGTLGDDSLLITESIELTNAASPVSPPKLNLLRRDICTCTQSER